LKNPKYLLLIVFAAGFAICTGCDHGLIPKQVSLSDPQLAPLLKAMEEVDRASLGFTAVKTNSQINLELHSPGGAYDAMLHVYGGTARTIAFRKTASGYRWIAEEEIHQGPKWYQTVDGTFQESLVVEYQTERVNGIPTNQIYIQYTGSDRNLTGREFTLAEVRPILQKWAATPVDPRPPDLPGGGFDPGPAMFVFLMLIALIGACILVVIVGLLCLGILVVMIGAGVISASVLTGVSRRSISSGFRAMFMQLGAMAGVIMGILANLAFSWITKADLHSPFRWSAAAGIGLFVGIFFAWIFNKSWASIAQLLTRKFVRTRN
jgi:hypothetical protein